MSGVTMFVAGALRSTKRSQRIPSRHEVERLRPCGETPLVYSALRATADLKSAGGGSVVLITDGEESCGGDVAAAANALEPSGLDFRLSIVGFTLTNQKARQEPEQWRQPQAAATIRPTMAAR